VSAPDSLSPVIRQLFVALEHAGDLHGAADAGASIAVGEAGREELGTRVRFTLAVWEGRIKSVRFRAYGCPYTLATCEWLARTLEGHRPEASSVGSPLDWARLLEVPAARLGRLLVIEDALLAALTRA
jgi:NifU-like protein involved in Fe-S cluster formation